MNRVTECIPYGHDNAVTRSMLSLLTGFSDREVRNMIMLDDDLIINLADGKGYFRPLPSEVDLVRKWKHSFKSRISEEQKRVNQAEEWMTAAIMCELMCPCVEEDW